jgi:hypothetical protein
MSESGGKSMLGRASAGGGCAVWRHALQTTTRATVQATNLDGTAAQSIAQELRRSRFRHSNLPGGGDVARTPGRPRFRTTET